MGDFLIQTIIFFSLDCGVHHIVDSSIDPLDRVLICYSRHIWDTIGKLLCHKAFWHSDLVIKKRVRGGAVLYVRINGVTLTLHMLYITLLRHKDALIEEVKTHSGYREGLLNEYSVSSRRWFGLGIGSCLKVGFLGEKWVVIFSLSNFANHGFFPHQCAAKPPDPDMCPADVAAVDRARKRINDSFFQTRPQYPKRSVRDAQSSTTTAFES
jgi:hypothetical protein